MPDILQIGLSALLTHQRALATTSNNIANASTPG
jgi:flagellar hook-associated protein FlgK